MQDCYSKMKKKCECKRESTHAWCILYNMYVCRESGIAGYRWDVCTGLGVWGGRREIGYCRAQNEDVAGMKKECQSTKQGSTRREKKRNKGHDRGRKNGFRRRPSIVSSDEPPVVKPALATPLASLTFLECVPETEGLVSSARDNCFPIRTHRKVKDTTCVACERSNHVQ